MSPFRPPSARPAPARPASVRRAIGPVLTALVTMVLALAPLTPGPLGPAPAAAQTAAGPRDEPPGDGPGSGDTAVAPADEVGRILNGWGKALLIGVAALVCIPLLGKRDVGGVVATGVIVLAVGGFVFAPDRMEALITSFWNTVTSS